MAGGQTENFQNVGGQGVVCHISFSKSRGGKSLPRGQRLPPMQPCRTHSFKSNYTCTLYVCVVVCVCVCIYIRVCVCVRVSCVCMRGLNM